MWLFGLLEDSNKLDGLLRNEERSTVEEASKSVTTMIDDAIRYSQEILDRDARRADEAASTLGHHSADV